MWCSGTVGLVPLLLVWFSGTVGLGPLLLVWCSRTVGLDPLQLVFLSGTVELVPVLLASEVWTTSGVGLKQISGTRHFLADFVYNVFTLL